MRGPAHLLQFVSIRSLAVIAIKSSRHEIRSSRSAELLTADAGCYSPVTRARAVDTCSRRGLVIRVKIRGADPMSDRTPRYSARELLSRFSTCPLSCFPCFSHLPSTLPAFCGISSWRVQPASQLRVRYRVFSKNRRGSRRGKG